jgi:hypothetical protein
MEKRGGEFNDPALCPALYPALYPTLGISGAMSDAMSDPFSSSSFKALNKDSTTTDIRLRKLLNEDLELGYWREKGLTIRHLKQWLGLGISEEDLFISLN